MQSIFLIRYLFPFYPRRPAVAGDKKTFTGFVYIHAWCSIDAIANMYVFKIRMKNLS